MGRFLFFDKQITGAIITNLEPVVSHGRPKASSSGNATPCPAMAGRTPNRKMAFFYDGQSEDIV
jgi:hypothetical protein